MKQTHRNMADVICDRLSAWRYDVASTVVHANLFGIQAAVENQEQTGWQSFLEGTPAKGWCDAQQAYLASIGSRKTGLRWLTALIIKLWDVAWDQWQHRNGILHDNETNILLAQEAHLIREQYRLGPAGLTKDGAIMLKYTLDETLALSPAIRTAWLIRVKASRERQVQNKTARSNSNRQERATMLRWLGRSSRITSAQQEQKEEPI
jgi:hypothetical protein